MTASPASPRTAYFRTSKTTLSLGLAPALEASGTGKSCVRMPPSGRTMPPTGVSQVRADEPRLAALHDLDHAAEVAARRPAADLGHDGVVGDGALGVLGADEKVLAAHRALGRLRNDEPEPPLRQAEPALHGVGRPGLGPGAPWPAGHWRAIRVCARSDGASGTRGRARQLQAAGRADLDVALAQHLLDERAELGIVLLGDVEEPGQAPDLGRVMVRFQVRQDLFAGGHAGSFLDGNLAHSIRCHGIRGNV